MRINSITAKDPGQNPLMNYQYTYDKMDNIVSKVTDHGNYTYMYDDLYRLASADNPVQDNEGFTYDGVGNRLTSLDVAGEWTYNNNNELLTTDNIQFSYDDNGNMIQKTADGVVTNFVYSVEDRLIEVRDGSDSLIASYYYDPLGRRLWKEVGGVRAYFLYTDEGLMKGDVGSKTTLQHSIKAIDFLYVTTATT
jgi:YD repeat-containing protein